MKYTHTSQISRLRRVLVVTALLTLCASLTLSARAQSPNPGDNYFNTSQNPVTNQLESMAASPDQKNYAIGNNPHGEHGEATGQETRMTSGGAWPAITPPQPVQLDARSARAVDAVVAATGTKGASGANLLSGNVASTAMAVGFQQAIARAQLPESMMPMAKEMQNQQNITNADNAAGMARNQAACAIDFVRTHLENFTINSSNKWNKLRDQLFIPMAVLLLLPGAVAAQGKAIVAQGFGIFGNVSPFDGIIRAIIAIFLIPGTYLVINYGIDVSNAISGAIQSAYRDVFRGGDMYRDAMAGQIRAFPIRKPSENLNYTPTDGGTGTGFADVPPALAGQNQDALSGMLASLSIKTPAVATTGSVSVTAPGVDIKIQTPQDPINAVLGVTAGGSIGGSLGSLPSGADTPFGRMEQRSLGIKLEDPAAGLYDSREGREYERLPYYVHAQRLGYNGANAALTTTWTILCAFQTAYLYYLWFVGPIVAALWVWPMQQLRQALPNWIDGVVTICFWNLFWNTTILLMACFRGVDDTGTVMMTALNFLSTACVKSAFDFSGLVRAAGAEAGKLAEKAAKGGSKGGGGSKGAGAGAETGTGSQGTGSGKQAGSGDGQKSAGADTGDGSSGGSSGGIPGGDFPSASMQSSSAFNFADGSGTGLGVEHTLPPSSDGATASATNGGSSQTDNSPVSSGFVAANSDVGVAPPPVTGGAASTGAEPVSSNFAGSALPTSDGLPVNSSESAQTSSADWTTLSAMAFASGSLNDPASFGNSEAANGSGWSQGTLADPGAGNGSISYTQAVAVTFDASGLPPASGSAASGGWSQPPSDVPNTSAGTSGNSTGSTPAGFDTGYAPPQPYTTGNANGGLASSTQYAAGSAATNYTPPPAVSKNDSNSATVPAVPPPPVTPSQVPAASPTGYGQAQTAPAASQPVQQANSETVNVAAVLAGAPGFDAGVVPSATPTGGSNTTNGPTVSSPAAQSQLHTGPNPAPQVGAPPTTGWQVDSHWTAPIDQASGAHQPPVAPHANGYNPGAPESVVAVNQSHWAPPPPAQHQYAEPSYIPAPPTHAPAAHTYAAPPQQPATTHQAAHAPQTHSVATPAPLQIHGPAPAPSHVPTSTPTPAPSAPPIHATPGKNSAATGGLLAALGKAAIPRLPAGNGSGTPNPPASGSRENRRMQGSLQDHLRPGAFKAKRRETGEHKLPPTSSVWGEESA